MRLTSLQQQVATHTGVFLCERINRPEETKTVQFCHVITPPAADAGLPDVGRLRDFFATFGSVVFYVDKLSGDEGKRIAGPDEWPDLDSDFRGWIDNLSESERLDVLPDWINNCLVIGEEPGTGNYILMPVSGKTAGRVFLFDHDGYEFVEKATDLVDYAERLLSPDDRLLADIATHMRFIDGDPMIQWWIRELRDNRGNVSTTAA